MKCNSLPGIVKIEMVNLHDLPDNAMEHSMTGHVVAIAASSERIMTVGMPILKWQSDVADNCAQESATLEFQTRRPLKDYKNKAFVVTGVSGHQYLIGTKEGRKPIITYTSTTGKPGSDAATYTYKVSHKAIKTALHCVL